MVHLSIGDPQAFEIKRVRTTTAPKGVERLRLSDSSDHQREEQVQQDDHYHDHQRSAPSNSL